MFPSTFLRHLQYQELIKAHRLSGEPLGPIKVCGGHINRGHSHTLEEIARDPQQQHETIFYLS